MTKKLTDGERIATHWGDEIFEKMAVEIDDLIRRRQAEAWEAGYGAHRDGVALRENPHRGRDRRPRR